MSLAPHRLLSASVVLAMVLASRAALAAPTSSSRELDAAHRWFDVGMTAARTGDLPAARKAFGAAYALVPSVDILWNLAATERKLGDNVAALEHLRVYVARADARADRTKVATEELLPELESATAHLVIAQAEDASVVVDGRPVAPSSTVDVLPGLHAISIRRGGRDQRFAVDAPAGVLTRVVAEAEVAPAVVAPPRAAPPPAAVTPSFEVGPASGSRRTLAVVSLGGAALVAIAGGVYFTLAAREQQSTADQLQTRMRSDDLSCKRSGTLCDDFESARGAAARDSMLGTSLLVGGGVLGGAAIAAWVLWPAATTRVTPIAAKNGGAVSVTGTF